MDRFRKNLEISFFEVTLSKTVIFELIIHHRYWGGGVGSR